MIRRVGMDEARDPKGRFAPYMVAPEGCKFCREVLSDEGVSLGFIYAYRPARYHPLYHVVSSNGTKACYADLTRAVVYLGYPPI